LAGTLLALVASLGLNFCLFRRSRLQSPLQSYKVVIFDAASVRADANGGLRTEYSQDELHLNTVGYAALNQGLSPVLLKLAP